MKLGEARGSDLAATKALRHNQTSTRVLHRLTLLGTGSQAGQAIWAGHWHCADLLTGLAAHLGQV